MNIKTDETLGINGFGRIGKLTVWHHIARKYFKKLIVNIGRNAGKSLADIAHYLERDSTYGSLAAYLYGFKAPDNLIQIDPAKNTFIVDGVEIQFLQTHRSPANIEWYEHDVKIVVDTTGQFLDPTQSADQSKGAVLRGHIDAGATKVIVSAPFKIKDKSKSMPDDCITTVMGINDNDYDPRRHTIISNASCTTTCLAHMIKPLIDYFGAKKILTASMATIHAATGSQQVLDRLPKSDAKDLRKNRSVFNNIILTSTGAAQTLSLVIPEMKHIGFIAESVRIPNVTGSLIILLVNLQEDISGSSIRRELINSVYQQAAQNDPNKYLQYSEKQNVSMDIVGFPQAATVIEGHETHTRTAEVSIDLMQVIGLGQNILDQIEQKMIRIPLTQTIVYGWYDNELGSYVNLLGDRTVTIAESLA